MKILGGHAIMLKILVPDDLASIGKEWINARTNRVPPKHPGHVTMLFVGRDLEDTVGHAMMSCASSLLAHLPATVNSLGEFAMFGGKNDTLVMLIEKTPALIELRKNMMEVLSGIGGSYAKSPTNFNPHLTLGVGCIGDMRPATKGPRGAMYVKGIDVKIGDSIQSLDSPQLQARNIR